MTTQGGPGREKTPPLCPWSPVVLGLSSLGSRRQENWGALLKLPGQREGLEGPQETS